MAQSNQDLTGLSISPTIQSEGLDSLLGGSGNEIITTKDRYTGMERLSGEAEAIHSQVYEKVVRQLGRPFERRVVYSFKEGGSSAMSIAGYPLMGVSSRIANMKYSSGYHSFIINNPCKGATPKDFFRMLLSHEYGHQVFDELYKERINPIAQERGTQEKAFKRAVDEAFAFWFGEEITGMNELTEDLAQEYSERYHHTIDANLMKFVYTQLKQASAQHGARYVIDNFVDIVMGGIGNVEEVTLPTSKELEWQQVMRLVGEEYGTPESNAIGVTVLDN